MAIQGFPTPVYEGDTVQFMYRMTNFVRTLPDIVQRITKLGLSKSFLYTKHLRFVETPERGAALCFYWKTTDTLAVYPMIFQVGDRIDLAVYEGFGTRYWENFMSSAQRQMWESLSLSAAPDLMRKLSADLKSGTPYDTVLGKYQRPVDRLQVIVVLNALKANHISPTQIKLLDIKTYPATAPFVTGQKPFSLRPLVSTYLGTPVTFPSMFAKYCSYNGRFPASDQSTEAALIALFKYVTTT